MSSQAPKRVPGDHPLARTYALLDPDLAPFAASALCGTVEIAEIEALVELLLNPQMSASACSAALRSLEHDCSPFVSDVVVKALGNQHPTVRILAAGEVIRRGLFESAAERLEQLFRTDPFWQVRRAAVNALAAAPGSFRWQIILAATDPHWRVRYALAQILMTWGNDERERERILDSLHETSQLGCVVRLRNYLNYRWMGQFPPERPSENPADWCSFWDWDPAVLARNLERLGRTGRRESLSVLPRLVNHVDERVRRWVIQSLRDDGEPSHWAEALSRLGDPREDTVPTQADLVRGLELDRVEAVARYILARDLPEAALEWALRQVNEAFPAEEVQTDLDRLAKALENHSPRVQAAFARIRGEACREKAEVYTAEHPYTRAADLSLERARELIHTPTLETSWFVLGRAARMCRVPIWKLAPEKEWKPVPEPREPRQSLLLPTISLVQPRQLGVGGPVVSPLGLSGHYGLPIEGFVRAAEQGVNLFFWEPNYATLSRFVTGLNTTDRRQIHILAGTFEADPTKIRKDVERAIRNLKLDRLSIFLIFWTQSWQRITPDVCEVFERLKAEGKVQVYGLSTHNRLLAAEAIREGWNPVMVRHSAAHRKAETEVFPLARERGTSIITFNNTCYGRLLDPGEGNALGFRPSDCYRFTLNTSGVSACFTAPSTIEFLEENLDALRNPELPDDVRERLICRGEWMYREDTVFRKTVRAEG